MEQEIRSYLVESFLLGEEGELSSSDSLLESGVLDSTGVLELVAFLEERFGIVVDNEDLIPDNLDSISNIGAFVRRKQEGCASGTRKTA